MNNKTKKAFAFSIFTLALIGGSFWAGNKFRSNTTQENSIAYDGEATAEKQDVDKKATDKPKVLDMPDMEGEFFGFDGIYSRSIIIKSWGEYPHAKISLKGYESRDNGHWEDRMRGMSSIEGYVDHLTINEEGNIVKGVFNAYEGDKDPLKASTQGKRLDGEVQFKVSEDGEAMLIIFREDTEDEQFWVCGRRDETLDIPNTEEYVREKAEAANLI